MTEYEQQEFIVAQEIFSEQDAMVHLKFNLGVNFKRTLFILYTKIT